MQRSSSIPQLWDLFVQYIRSEVKRVIVEVTKFAQDQWHRLRSNSKAFSARFLDLAREPMGFGPLISDYTLLVQSIWSAGRQPGPKVVYPMQCIKERQSGPLADLILEYCRAYWWHHRVAETRFPQNVEPPCVVVVDLDPIAQDGYSTRVDLYGLTCLLIFLEVIVALAVQMLNLLRFNLPRCWTTCIMHSLAFFILAVYWGEGTVTLTQRSNTSTSGYAVLLDQDLTVIMTGSESALEAIAESSFNPPHYDHTTRNLFRILIYMLCQWLLFYPVLPELHVITAVVESAHTLASYQRPQLGHLTPALSTSWLPILSCLFSSLVAVVIFFSSSIEWLGLAHLSIPLFFVFISGYKPRSYPIRTAKLIDTLGHPPVVKWQFDTLAAAATFQCLVLCRRIPRPIESIDVSAYLDMLIPDQRDVWRTWKKRVADRIVHEPHIPFAPTLPTFGDERQVQLRDLLRDAQSGYDTYNGFYGSDLSDAWDTLVRFLPSDGDSRLASLIVLSVIFFSLTPYFYSYKRLLGW